MGKNIKFSDVFIAGFVIMDNSGNVAMKDWAGDTLGHVSSIGSSGINVGISFGGAHGTSPSVYAASNGRSADWLYNQYVNTIERIDNIKYVDWDVEGAAAGNSRASRLRNEAIKRLRTRYPKLKLSVTVATAAYGVVNNVWNNVVKPLKGSINNVNIMAMDYGGPMSESAMLNAAKSATTATANRLAREGWIDQNNKYSMVGLIPMIGKNDIASEIFTLNSARKIAEWAVKVHLGTLSMWSITRDENGIIIDKNHKTLPILTKYERTKILGQRAKQINNGDKPYVNVAEKVIDGYSIAELELKQKKIPFIIRRPLGNGNSEYWKLSDLEQI